MMALIFSSDATIYSQELNRWLVRATYYTTDQANQATPMPPVMVPVASPSKVGILESLKAFGVQLEASISPEVAAMQTVNAATGVLQKYTLSGAEV